MRSYGELPTCLGAKEVECKELMFYQYLPIKLSFSEEVGSERRLSCFNELIGECLCDYVGLRGLDSFISSYVYLTAKSLFQPVNTPFNREGWHSDGFMTDDVNYIWSDKFPTVFSCGSFDLTQDHSLSLIQMEQQAQGLPLFRPGLKELVRMDQYSIHRVGEVDEPGVRTFFKLSISKDKYNLIGNAHNHLLDYNWEMQPRQLFRNNPTKTK